MDVPIFNVKIRGDNADLVYDTHGYCSTTVGDLVQGMIVGMVVECDS